MTPIRFGTEPECLGGSAGRAIWRLGTYFDDDPKLWQEIKEKGHGMIMAIGH